MAYSEAIKAIEAAAAPVVAPNDSTATLGRVIGEMRANAARWTFAIVPHDVSAAVNLMDSLWRGQTDRHGGSVQTVPVTVGAAEAAVHLAISLVHSSAVRTGSQVGIATSR